MTPCFRDGLDRGRLNGSGRKRNRVGTGVAGKDSRNSHWVLTEGTPRNVDDYTDGLLEKHIDLGRVGSPKSSS